MQLLTYLYQNAEKIKQRARYANSTFNRGLFDQRTLELNPTKALETLIKFWNRTYSPNFQQLNSLYYDKDYPQLRKILTSIRNGLITVNIQMDSRGRITLCFIDKKTQAQANTTLRHTISDIILHHQNLQIIMQLDTNYKEQESQLRSNALQDMFSDILMKILIIVETDPLVRALLRQAEQYGAQLRQTIKRFQKALFQRIQSILIQKTRKIGPLIETLRALIKHDPGYVRRLFEIKEGHILVAVFSSQIRQVVKYQYCLKEHFSCYSKEQLQEYLKKPKMLDKVFRHVLNIILFKAFGNEITTIRSGLYLEEVLQATRLESHRIRILRILFNVNFPLREFSPLLEAIQKMSNSIKVKGRSAFTGILLDNSFKTVMSIKDHQVSLRNPTDQLDYGKILSFDELEAQLGMRQDRCSYIDDKNPRKHIVTNFSLYITEFSDPAREASASPPNMTWELSNIMQEMKLSPDKIQILYLIPLGKTDGSNKFIRTDCSILGAKVLN